MEGEAWPGVVFEKYVHFWKNHNTFRLAVNSIIRGATEKNMHAQFGKARQAPPHLSEHPTPSCVLQPSLSFSLSSSPLIFIMFNRVVTNASAPVQIFIKRKRHRIKLPLGGFQIRGLLNHATSETAKSYYR